MPPLDVVKAHHEILHLGLAQRPTPSYILNMAKAPDEETSGCDASPFEQPEVATLTVTAVEVPDWTLGDAKLSPGAAAVCQKNVIGAGTPAA